MESRKDCGKTVRSSEWLDERCSGEREQLEPGY